MSTPPRIHYRQPGDESTAQDAVDLVAAYGLTLDPRQELALRAAMATRPGGGWAAPRFALSVPRQQGKSALLEVRILCGMVLLGERILFTAHLLPSARAVFARLMGFLDNPRQHPDLAEKVRKIRNTNGSEGIWLHNGASLQFIARSKSSGRGFSADLLIVDEAQDAGQEELAALLPTISASSSPQVLFAGTPPVPGVDADVFRRVRDAALRGDDARLAYLEWSAASDADLDDVAAWRQANPSLGIRLHEDTVRDERAAMDDATFARERLGIWAELRTAGLYAPATWDALADTTSEIAEDEPLAFALDVNPNRDRASISVAGLRADGLLHVETVETRSGDPAWAVAWLAERCERWGPRAVVVDSIGPAAALADRLVEAGVPLTLARTRDVTDAAAQFHDAVNAGTLRHLSAPGLTASVLAARKRSVGTSGAFAFQRSSLTTDLTPLVSVSLAAWAVTASGVTKPKKPRTGRAMFV